MVDAQRTVQGRALLSREAGRGGGQGGVSGVGGVDVDSGCSGGQRTDE